MSEVRFTTCNRDCPDACRIAATVEQGRITALRGDPHHPITQGFLCHRTANFLQRQYASDRVTVPLVRRNGTFATASWDAALDLCAEKLLGIRAESGPAAIFHYLSGGSLGALQGVVGGFWQAFGATVKRGDICSGAGDAAQETDFGLEDSNDIFDLLNSRHILLWGKNPAVSGPHLLPILRQARDKGATLTLIDPVHHKTAHLCGQFVQVKPAGDFALAMAVAQVLFSSGKVSPEAAELCDNLPEFERLAFRHSLADWCRQADVPRSAAEMLADKLADGPTNIQVGWGMGRRGNGGAIVRALDALCAISGNLRVAGGGSSFYYKRRAAFAPLFPHLPKPPRTICEPLFGQELLAATDPPIRAVWVTAGNPVAMLPDSRATVQALQTRELVVVADQFLTDTAQQAHVVLPAATLLETDDIAGAYGHHWLGTADAVVPPLGQARTDLAIVQGIAERLGMAELVAGTADQWRQRAIGPTLGPLGIGVDQIRAGGLRNPLAPQVLFAGRKLPTATGKVQLLTDGDDAPADDAQFPMFLFSLSTEKSQSSQWNQPPSGPAEVTVHPSRAPVGNGEMAMLQSRLGSLQVRVRADARQRPDVCVIPKGGDFAGGRCANALVQAKLTDIGEGGALYDERVRLVAA